MNSAISNIVIVERMLLKELLDEERLLRVVRNDGAFGYVWLFDVFKKQWPFPIEHAAAIKFLTASEPSYRLEHEDPWPPSIHDVGPRKAADEAQEKRSAAIHFSRHRGIGG
ncbi:MAG: hypothetical protein JZU55_21065 [Afipia sp.]|nr:hypothetical protein [Afipia sp.]